MTTLNEDLERVAAVLRGVTDHEVEVVDRSVYVNFGVYEAITVDTELTSVGMRYHVWVMSWDLSGGLDSETELGVVSMRALPGLVKGFLDEEARRESELDKLLSMLDTE